MALARPNAVEVDFAEVIADMEEACPELKDEPLSNAVISGDVEAVRQIINAREDPWLMNAKHIAVVWGKHQVLRCLLEKDPEGNAYLVEVACNLRDKESILMLLEFGWPINHPIRVHGLVLWTAFDDVDFTRFLINNGADVNARSTTGESVLSPAVANGHIDYVRFLISQGTDVTHGDLLHCAAFRKDQKEGAELVEEFVQKGNDVNKHRWDSPVAWKLRYFHRKPTPLQAAVMNDNIPVAKVLLKHGADPQRQYLQPDGLGGSSALELAIEKNNAAMIDLLAGAIEPRADNEAS